MTKLTLLDLPPEIITAIFQQLPYRSIRDLERVPQLRPYALKELYKVVKVYLTEKRVPAEISVLFRVGHEHDTHRRPISVNFNQLVALIRDKRASFIRHISFEDPRALLNIHDMYPSVLSNVLITVSFELFLMYTRGHDFVWFFQEFKKLPYDFTAADSFRYFNPAVYGENSSWFNKFESLTINELASDAINTITQAEFTSLTTLKCSAPVDVRFVKYFPRTVTQLKCVVCRSETVLSSRLAFPKKLRSLEIRYVVVSGLDDDFPAELNHLRSLELLKCDSASFYKLPKSLLTINTFLPLNIEQVMAQCPALEVMNCREFDVPDELCELPHGLRKLQMNSRGLDYVVKLELGITLLSGDRPLSKKQKTESRTKVVKFPKGLQSLVIAGNLHVYKTLDYEIFSNCPGFALDCLTDLKIQWYWNCQKLGLWPKFLKRLSIIDCKGVDFGGLLDLASLMYLTIEGTHVGTFNVKLPSTLVQLEMRDNLMPKFTADSTEATSLYYLVLKGNKFTELNDSVVHIPPSVKELDLSHNEISSINPSFRFPLGLLQLSLLHNELSVLPELPAGLEKFSAAMNRLGRKGQVFHFPSSLEELDLHYNVIQGGYPFSRLSLLSCPRLRKLDLGNGNWHNDEDEVDLSQQVKIELSHFPKSLTSLSIRGCNATKINGSLLRFPHLEEIDMRENEGVAGLFHMRDGHGPYFGDAIKLVWITKRYFEPEKFDKFVEMMKKMPNFECLVVAEQEVVDSGNIIHKWLRSIRAPSVGWSDKEYWSKSAVVQ
ncbi:Leucine-rich repeat transmembrane neuronal protein 1 [Candida viswanathii]|uniref:Leucine-rich repeat transmembrane neuronal protein 1 n=1 Tax=Candida viswanathii TaxID=5486 RepID=A0A367YEJ8_9ASCO|nr:Leucine-rich repeat transmembrane neuronal protein 1 [Candida viswanathii]